MDFKKKKIGFLGKNGWEHHHHDHDTKSSNVPIYSSFGYTCDSPQKKWSTFYRMMFLDSSIEWV